MIKKANFRLNVEYFKRVLMLILIMSLFFVLFGLYVPIKRLILGDNVLLSDVLNSINYVHYVPFILIGSIIYGFFSGDSKNEKAE
jgi:hypothetical protein